MALAEITGGISLSNILAVVLKTNEQSPREYLLETASECTLKASVSSGSENELRKRNAILAVNKKLDIVKGYDVTLKDLLLNPKVHALIQGGVTTEASGAFSSYTDPVVGTPVTRVPFSLDIYCGNIGTEGESAAAYTKFSLPNCKGKPVDFELKDDDFYSPSYTIESRPARGETPLTVSSCDNLPAVAGE